MIKAPVRILCLIVLLQWLTSCNSDGKYVVANDKVYHSYWTFSFGYVYNTLPEVDASTFESVKNWVGHDARHVYFKEVMLPGADVGSLKVHRYPLLSDNRDYYYMGRPLHVRDVESFQVLKWSDNDMWARDSRYAYYDTILITSPDIESFKVKNYCAAVDSRYVYYYGKILPLADPATFEPDWKDLYSRDKAHIWYVSYLLEDVDYDSFTVDKDGRGHDRWGYFDGQYRVTDDSEAAANE